MTRRTLCTFATSANNRGWREREGECRKEMGETLSQCVDPRERHGVKKDRAFKFENVARDGADTVEKNALAERLADLRCACEFNVGKLVASEESTDLEIRNAQNECLCELQKLRKEATLHKLYAIAHQAEVLEMELTRDIVSKVSKSQDESRPREREAHASSVDEDFRNIDTAMKSADLDSAHGVEPVLVQPERELRDREKLKREARSMLDTLLSQNALKQNHGNALEGTSLGSHHSMTVGLCTPLDSIE